jgi:alpha/beta superfamily hydrolase
MSTLQLTPTEAPALAHAPGAYAEESFFLGGGDDALYATLYSPRAGRRPRRCCVLLNPLDNEADNGLRFYVRMARLIAARGVLAVRFDYRGTGNSGGSFGSVSLGSLLGDIARVRELVAGRCDEPTMCLLGARFGAALALLHCAAGPGVDEFVLWDPVLDVANYLRQNFVNRTILAGKLCGVAEASSSSALARALESEGVVELRGLAFGRAFYAELQGFPAESLTQPRVGSGLILAPQAQASACHRRVLAALGRRPAVSVVPVAAGRAPVGWDAENFSRDSALVPELREATLRFLFGGSPATGRQ